MKALGIGILGSGRGSNCRAILEAIRAGTLPARACIVVSDVLDAPILDIAQEFSVPNAYLPPGQFRTRLEPAVEADLVRMLRDAGHASEPGTVQQRSYSCTRHEDIPGGGCAATLPFIYYRDPA